MGDLDAWTRPVARALLPSLAQSSDGPALAHWLGQPMRPLGRGAFNYFVADATACPPDLQPSGAVDREKLLLLPHYYALASATIKPRATLPAAAAAAQRRARGS